MLSCHCFLHVAEEDQRGLCKSQWNVTFFTISDILKNTRIFQSFILDIGGFGEIIRIIREKPPVYGEMWQNQAFLLP